VSTAALAPPTTATEGRVLAWRILRHHAKSFSWAARLLPAWCRRDAAAIYAWCRRCDDAVDEAPHPAAAANAVFHLRAELDLVFGPDDVPDKAPTDDPVLEGFRDVVRRRRIPRLWAEELVAGMAMDVGPVRYDSYAELLVYCYRVAGTVGLMMARVMGVTDACALRRAAKLGMAMQLTNICRDVVEDAGRDRVYLPSQLLDGGTPYAVSVLLRRADLLYQSGDRGLAALPAACAAAIRAARLIYADIGRVIAAREFDVSSGRAIVPRRRKLWLSLRALVETAVWRLGWSPRP
jgi:phytoene synthase